MRALLVALLCPSLSMALAPIALGAQPIPIPAPTLVPQAPVQPRALAMALADRLASDFVYPDIGARYAATLRAKAAAGDYDALRGPDLASRMTADLQAVAADGHLRVTYQGSGGGPRLIIRPPNETGAAPSPSGQPRMIMMPGPPAMEQARWLAPGIAFVRFNLFPGGPEPSAAAWQFMATHADAKAIVFDLRSHRGGGLEEMDAIFPWLYAEPTRLVTMATRASVDAAGGSPVTDGPSLRRVGADPNFVNREHWVMPGSDTRLNNTKVYVLTSALTASAAEHFAAALKNTARGTIVGQPTYGANHFGGDRGLGGDYGAFIPVGRTFDPASGKDWEGVGIKPDIEVPAEDALVKALTLAGVDAAKAATLSAEVAPAMPMVRPSRA